MALAVERSVWLGRQLTLPMRAERGKCKKFLVSADDKEPLIPGTTSVFREREEFTGRATSAPTPKLWDEDAVSMTSQVESLFSFISLLCEVKCISFLFLAPARTGLLQFERPSFERFIRGDHTKRKIKYV
jgi:hypothetical protein